MLRPDTSKLENATTAESANAAGSSASVQDRAAASSTAGSPPTTPASDAKDVTAVFNVQPDGHVVISGIGNVVVPSQLIRETSIDPALAAAVPMPASQPKVALTAEERKAERTRLLKEAREKNKRQVEEAKAEAQRRGASVTSRSRAATTQQPSKRASASTARFSREAIVTGSKQSALTAALAAQRPAVAVAPPVAAAASTPAPAIAELDEEKDAKIKKLYFELLKLERDDDYERLPVQPNQILVLYKAKLGLQIRRLKASGEVSQWKEAEALSDLMLKSWEEAIAKVEHFVITKEEAEKLRVEAKKQGDLKEKRIAEKVKAARDAASADTTVKSVTRTRFASVTGTTPHVSSGKGPAVVDDEKLTDDQLVNLYTLLISKDSDAIVTEKGNEADRAASINKAYFSGTSQQKLNALSTVKIGLHRRILKASGLNEQEESFSSKTLSDQYDLVQDIRVTQETSDLLFQKQRKEKEAREQGKKEAEAKELAAMNEKFARESEEQRRNREKTERARALANMTVSERRKALQPAPTAAKKEHMKLLERTRKQEEQERDRRKKIADRIKKEIADRIKKETERRQFEQSEREKETKIKLKKAEKAAEHFNHLYATNNMDEIQNIHFPGNVEHKGPRKQSRKKHGSPAAPAGVAPKNAGAPTKSTGTSPIGLAALALSSMPSELKSSAVPAGVAPKQAVITQHADGKVDIDLTGAYVPRSLPMIIGTGQLLESDGKGDSSSAGNSTDVKAAAPITVAITTSPMGTVLSRSNTPVDSGQYVPVPPVFSGWKKPAIAGVATTFGLVLAGFGFWFFGVGALPGLIIAGVGLFAGTIVAKMAHLRALNQYLAENYNELAPSKDDASDELPPQKIYVLKASPDYQLRVYKDGQVRISYPGAAHSFASSLEEALSKLPNIIRSINDENKQEAERAKQKAVERAQRKKELNSKISKAKEQIRQHYQEAQKAYDILNKNASEVGYQYSKVKLGSKFVVMPQVLQDETPPGIRRTGSIDPHVQQEVDKVRTASEKVKSSMSAAMAATAEVEKQVGVIANAADMIKAERASIAMLEDNLREIRRARVVPPKATPADAANIDEVESDVTRMCKVANKTEARIKRDSDEATAVVNNVTATVSRMDAIVLALAAEAKAREKLSVGETDPIESAKAERAIRTMDGIRTALMRKALSPVKVAAPASVVTAASSSQEAVSDQKAELAFDKLFVPAKTPIPYQSRDVLGYVCKDEKNTNVRIFRNVGEKAFFDKGLETFHFTDAKGMPIHTLRAKDGREIPTKEIRGLKMLLDILHPGVPEPGAAPAKQPASPRRA